MQPKVSQGAAPAYTLRGTVWTTWLNGMIPWLVRLYKQDYRVDKYQYVFLFFGDLRIEFVYILFPQVRSKKNQTTWLLWNLIFVSRYTCFFNGNMVFQSHEVEDGFGKCREADIYSYRLWTYRMTSKRSIYYKSAIRNGPGRPHYRYYSDRLFWYGGKCRFHHILSM